MRVMGIDYGRARIGLALGDTDSRIASPWGVLEETHTEAAIRRILDMVTREGVERVVVGVPRPLHDRSRETDQAREIRAFIGALLTSGIDAVEEDETLTSALAAKQALEMGERGKRDDLAAAAILQTYLDRLPHA